ncbi:MAG TPA: multicopper oxidase domain-containing protein [bacterium]
MAVGFVFALGVAAMAAPPPPAVQTPLNPTKIPQFVEPLNTLSNAMFQIATGTPIDVSICEFQTNILPAGTPVVGAVAGVAPATWVWGYQVGNTCVPGLQNRSYLGPVVIADRGIPTQMNFFNKLPDTYVSNVKAYTTSTDPTLLWGDPLSLNTAPPPVNFNDPVGTANPERNLCDQAAQAWIGGLGPAVLPAPCLNNYGFLGPQAAPPNNPLTYPASTPAAVHLHGGEIPSVLDGGPDSWWTGNGIYGHGYYSKGGVADAAAGKATYVYPNVQDPAPTWFHDHMLGATRLNVYAGIAGVYDQVDPAMPLAPGLDPLGLKDTVTGAVELLVPMILQDRIFDTNGQLYFPNVGINPEHPYWVPEFIGDTIVVNGKTWPFMNVQPKRYRFLFLNGSNARTYALYFMNRTTGVQGPPMWVIGNDQGYLDTPQQINPLAKVNDKLLIMPGERYEVIVDFSTVAGQTLILTNNAPAPFPGGAQVSASTTGRIVQFRVAAAPVVDNTFNPAVLPAPAIRPASVRLTTPLGTTPAAGVTIHKTRRLTLNEVVFPGGPVEILVNNTQYDGTKVARTDFTPVATMWNTTYYSELPHEGETEEWEIVNLTADAHPIHPHLVAVQLLNRQGLNVKAYTTAYTAAYAASALPVFGAGPPLDYNCGLGVPGRGVLAPNVCVLGGNPDPANIYGWQFPAPAVATTALVGLPVAPAPQEIGWKDTVMAPPGMVTRFIVRFAKATAPVVDPVTGLDNSNTIGYDFSPNGGHGYVWHCHIIDHEDNEMMRPYTVLANPAIVRTYVKGVQY